MIQKARVPAICKLQVEVWRQSKAFGPDALLLVWTTFPLRGLTLHSHTMG